MKEKIKLYRFYDEKGNIWHHLDTDYRNVEKFMFFSHWVPTAPSLHDPRDGYVCHTECQ
jgi:hypothetical protein